MIDRQNFFNTKLPALQTMSDVDIRRQPEYSMPVCIDWRKVGLYLKGEWPKKWPSLKFFGDDMLDDMDWLNQALKAEYIVFDVETVQISKNPDRWSKVVFQVGLYPKGQLPRIWDKYTHPDYMGVFQDIFRALAETKPMVAHNAQFDCSRMRFNFGVEIHQYHEIHDTICMAGILFAEFPKNLEFLASICSEHPKAKHLGVGDHDYLVGDVVATSEIFEYLMGEFQRDPESYRLYRQTLFRLLPITVRVMKEGFPVNPEFVIECLEWIPRHLKFAESLAKSYTGFEISLNSAPQLRAYLDGVEDIYGQARKAGAKGLRRKLTEKGELSFDKDAVNTLRTAFLAIDYNEDLTPELVLQRIDEGAHPLLEAKALHGKARVYLANYVKPLLVELEERDGKLFTTAPLHVGEGSPDE